MRVIQFRVPGVVLEVCRRAPRPARAARIRAVLPSGHVPANAGGDRHYQAARNCDLARPGSPRMRIHAQLRRLKQNPGSCLPGSFAMREDLHPVRPRSGSGAPRIFLKTFS